MKTHKKSKVKTSKKSLTIEEKLDKGYVWVYTPYITRKGKVIYHPTGGVFKFLVPPR